VSTTVFLVVTAAVLGVVALALGDGRVPWPPPAGPTIALIYLAVVGSVVAFVTYFWLLGKTSLLVTSTLVFVYPLVAIVTDAIAGDETLTGRAYLGAGVTLSGLVVSLRRR
jgi:drug/metabolite transporter (DMT)-like permease